MAEAYYEPTPATDGATMNPVPGAVFQVFEIADTSFSTPLSLRVGSGNTTTSVTASETLATLPGVYVTSPNFEHIWKSGTFEWRRDSIDGAKAAIEAAKISASDSAISAAASEQSARDAANLVDAPADTAVKTLLDDTASQTRIAANKLFARGVNVVAHGVIGDGIADDTAAMNSALSTAQVNGAPVYIPPGLTIGLSNAITLHDGMTVNTSGSKFKALVTLGRTAFIQVKSNVRVIGGLKLDTLGGDNCGGITLSGITGARIDSVRTVAATAGAGKNNTRDNGLKIVDSSDIEIGSAYVENYDNAYYAERVPNLRIGWIEAKTYTTALHLDDVPHFRLTQGGYIRGASPNTAYVAGHNGLLMGAELDGSENIRINNLAVHDAGEHGFRIGGPKSQKNIWLSNCSAINSGGTGFKVLGATLAEGIFNENIHLDNCLAEDSGSVNQNCNGFLIQMTRYVTLTNPKVRKRNKTYAAVNGIRISGSHNMVIDSPLIDQPSQYGIHIDESHGAVSSIDINDAKIKMITGFNIYLQNPGVDFKDISITANCKNTSASGGSAFYAGRATLTDNGTWTGFHRIDLRVSPDTVPVTVNTASSVNYLAACYAKLEAKKNTTVLFRNGSEWLDHSTGLKYLAKADAWVEQ